MIIVTAASEMIPHSLVQLLEESETGKNAPCDKKKFQLMHAMKRVEQQLSCTSEYVHIKNQCITEKRK
jgi:hypothetical protein